MVHECVWFVDGLPVLCAVKKNRCCLQRKREGGRGCDGSKKLSPHKCTHVVRMGERWAVTCKRCVAGIRLEGSANTMVNSKTQERKMVMTYKNVASSLMAAAVVRVRPKIKYRNLATRPEAMLNRKDLQDVAAMVRGYKGGTFWKLYTNVDQKHVDVLRNIGSSTGHWRYCSNKH